VLKFVHSLLARFRQDEDFRLNVSYAILMPIYVALIVSVFWWGIRTG
jgi:hypothetical protein